uniref:Uncharacterized protein n=1 Tax=Fagus sylvatica TaxID=28930 RepID=A0A2N9IT60_FAGSY
MEALLALFLYQMRCLVITIEYTSEYHFEVIAAVQFKVQSYPKVWKSRGTGGAYLCSAVDEVGELEGGAVGLENPPQIEADAPDPDPTRRFGELSREIEADSTRTCSCHHLSLRRARAPRTGVS